VLDCLGIEVVDPVLADPGDKRACGVHC